MIIKTSKIRQSAKGENCQVRIPKVCNFNPETTVFAHLAGGGMGAKVSDLHGAYCCSSCHDRVDGRTVNLYNKDVIRFFFLEGIIRTQTILIKKGLVKL